MGLVPRQEWKNPSIRLIFHGRAICKACLPHLPLGRSLPQSPRELSWLNAAYPPACRMAKKSMIARDVKRSKMTERFAAKRAAFKEAMAAAADPMERLEIHRKLQGLPRNSAPSRRRNRCWATGKPRGVYRDFGLCRNQLRERAHKGELPGVVKSSW